MRFPVFLQYLEKYSTRNFVGYRLCCFRLSCENAFSIFFDAYGF
ncbi:hypothetical protein T11_14215 [Trichinella zimbabwensis]|uniref:Uncharacterized protein n=1 Tax=Trichinella zimbabwensis TaxID=268475 RepID=A0A0V1GNU8_9BILA|nr:hypothetical protein T11_5418 [Trichinella zimbabwensis]KRY99926.1 hypothetical protein T11_3021 [Trichinella zimbabwensis]KRY99963.1 hypothetical protein T11_14215 [Trichinella zimbabwensis]